jgi:hypothetical protein
LMSTLKIFRIQRKLYEDFGKDLAYKMG